MFKVKEKVRTNFFELKSWRRYVHPNYATFIPSRCTFALSRHHSSITLR